MQDCSRNIPNRQPNSSLRKFCSFCSFLACFNLILLIGILQDKTFHDLLFLGLIFIPVLLLSGVCLFVCSPKCGLQVHLGFQHTTVRNF